MKKIFALGIFVLASFAAMAQHTVVLKNGDKMTGTVESMNNGIITFKNNGGETKLKVSEVSAVYFDNKWDTGKPMSESKVQTAPGEKTVMAGSYTVRYKCASRNIVKPPVVSNLTEEKGTVVVDITIDKYGHVMKATPGASGTTTDSDYLRTKAKQAAESAMFDNVPTAPLETTGYIIFKY